QCKFKHFKKRQSLKKRLETSSSELLITWVTSNLNDWNSHFTMKFALISTNSTHPFAPFCACACTSSNSKQKYQYPNPNTTFFKPFTLPTILSLKSSHSKPSRLVVLCASRAAKPSNAELENNRLDEEVLSEETIVEDENSQSQWNVEVGNPIVPANVVKLSLSDQAFLLLAFIACTVQSFQFFSVNCVVRLAAFNSFNGTSVAFTSLVIAAVPTLYILYTPEEGQAMIQERANLPIISLQPVVAGAAKKTSHAVGQVTKTFMNMISRGEFSSENEDDSGIDRVEI
ncbi:hypothetical protein CFP56_006894, partial [Quercus suber]